MHAERMVRPGPDQSEQAGPALPAPNHGERRSPRVRATDQVPARGKIVRSPTEPTHYFRDDPFGFDRFETWYAVHKPIWDLPDASDEDLEQLGIHCWTLARVPQRKTLLRLLGAVQQRRELLAAAEDSYLRWLGDRMEGDETEVERRSRLDDVERQFFTRLSRELPASDYRLILARAERRHLASAPTARPGSDVPAAPAAYVNASAFRDRFHDWYFAFHDELGLPSRTLGALKEVGEDIVGPLGTIPPVEELSLLMNAYNAAFRQERRSRRSDDALRDFFTRVQADLPAEISRRLLLSPRWRADVRRLDALQEPK
ncbi:MAG: hypothetical protein AAGD14_07210 [Planctomycetota bacterium]